MIILQPVAYESGGSLVFARFQSISLPHFFFIKSEEDISCGQIVNVTGTQGVFTFLIVNESAVFIEAVVRKRFDGIIIGFLFRIGTPGFQNRMSD